MAENLSAQQEMFCHEYLVDLNATQAAIRAGYSPSTAKQQGSRLLTNVDVSEFVERLMAERAARVDVTSDRVLAELSVIGFANASDYFDWGPDGVRLKDSDELTRVQAAAVAEIQETTTQHGGSIRLKLSDKQAALEKIGRHIGMFVTRHEVGRPGDFTGLSDKELEAIATSGSAGDTETTSGPAKSNSVH